MDNLPEEPLNFPEWFLGAGNAEKFPEIALALIELREPFGPHNNMTSAYKAFAKALGRKPPKNSMPFCGIWHEYAKKARKAYKKALTAQKNQRGPVSLKLRFQILQRDDFACRYCGQKASDGAVLEVDHIHPASKGGLTVEANLQTLCFACNRGKRDRLV